MGKDFLLVIMFIYTWSYSKKDEKNHLLGFPLSVELYIQFHIIFSSQE